MDDIDQAIMDEMDEMEIDSTTFDEIQRCKRQRSEEDTSIIMNEELLKQSKTTLLLDGIKQEIPKRLRLEAIFHPKFDNDKELGDIRQMMISKVSSGLGCLEVSLKHSGSLLLWSGGQRYYSKNSTNNVFTLTGEILLRQHFARAWFHDNTTTAVAVTTSSSSSTMDTTSFLQEKYNECSAYILKNRLTLAFELVTSLLGDHGEIPLRDYMILTAVARLDTGTFLTTSQLIAFAKMFRLPHNDAWLFRTHDSVLALLNVYDSFRETGYADFITTSLTSVADGGYFRSMYPHTLFQGNLLEGLVIRYVSNEESWTSANTLDSSLLEQDLLTLVPPDRPAIYDLVQGINDIPPVFTTNIRTLAMTSQVGQLDGINITKLLPALQTILKQTDGGYERRREVMSVASNVVALTRKMQNASLDTETEKITKVLLKLDSLGVAKTLNLYCENCWDPSIRSMKKRYICIVHVIHDESFKKFAKTLSPGDMNLFRGFSIELDFDGIDDTIMHVDESKYRPLQSTTDTIVSLPMEKDPLDSTLMLKMKLLPYMVRTFICRNGLSTVQRSGPKGYDQFVSQMLNKWGISQSSKSLWFPFLSAWGKYSHLLMQDGCGSELNKYEIDHGNSALPPLKSSFYLRHLHRFSDLFYSGKLAKMKLWKEKLRDFKGLVVILGVNLDEMRSIASAISRKIGYLNLWIDYNPISEENLYDGGYIVGTNLDNGPCVSIKTVKDLSSKGHNIFLVLIGCTAAEIEQNLLEFKNTKKLLGIASGWRKVNFKELIDIPRDRFYGNNPDNTSASSPEIEQLPACEELSKLYETLGKHRNKSANSEKIGSFVFFPSIPGSGKSSLCGIFKENLHSFDENCYEKLKDREIVVKEADNTKGKYYPQATREKCMKPSSVYVSDKNAPPTAWETIEQICARCSNTAIAVIPDTHALQTTVIEYATPTGRIVTEKYPFSLHYLAVCISRVLKRPSSSHAGKLDVATPNACMIVVKFYWLYKNVTAESFGEQLNDKLGSDILLTPVKVPFFIQNIPQLPSDLDSLLREAISLQSRVDCDKPKKEEQALLSEIETKIREAIHRHMDFLGNLTVPLNESRLATLHQITDRIVAQDADSSDLGAKPLSLSKSSNDFISYASLDLDLNEVQTAVTQVKIQHDVLKQYLEDMNMDESWWIRKSHVTLAHHTSVSQLEMRTRFGSILGRKVTVHVHGILLNKQIAALKVSLGPTCIGSPSIPVPAPANSFVHITLWCCPDASAVEANNLPMLHSLGQACDFTLPEGGHFDLIGTVTFVK